MERSTSSAGPTVGSALASRRPRRDVGRADVGLNSRPKSSWRMLQARRRPGAGWPGWRAGWRGSARRPRPSSVSSPAYPLQRARPPAPGGQASGGQTGEADSTRAVAYGSVRSASWCPHPPSMARPVGRAQGRRPACRGWSAPGPRDGASPLAPRGRPAASPPPALRNGPDRARQQGIPRLASATAAARRLGELVGAAAVAQHPRRGRRRPGTRPGAGRGPGADGGGGSRVGDRRPRRVLGVEQVEQRRIGGVEGHGSVRRREAAGVDGGQRRAASR